MNMCEYVAIQFPLRQVENLDDGDDNQFRDDQILEKLNNFGKNFR